MRNWILALCLCLSPPIRHSTSAQQRALRDGEEDDDGVLRCYVCNPQRDFHCSPQDLWGNLTRCPDGVKVCYKSWTVEADPKTQRRCGKLSDVPNAEGKCEERLKKNNKAIVCKCDSSGCNAGQEKAASVALTAAALLALSLSTGATTVRSVYPT